MCCDKATLRLSVAVLMTTLICCASAGFAGNKQLMTEKMAIQDMKRNMVEAVVGFKVRSTGEFGLTQDAKYKIEEKAAALIKGIQVDKMVYDPVKDVAFCVGHLDLGNVRTVFPDLKRYKGVTVLAFGFGTMSESARPPLMALRAAFLNAYDQMAAILVGEKISGYSETENFILTEDTNKSKVCAAVYGAYVPNVEINSKDRGWGWDENGNAYVKLRIDARKVRDIIGQRIRYEGPNVIEVVGRGAQVDELSEPVPQGSGLGPGGKTEYRSLDIPVQSGNPQPSNVYPQQTQSQQPDTVVVPQQVDVGLKEPPAFPPR